MTRYPLTITTFSEKLIGANETVDPVAQKAYTDFIMTKKNVYCDSTEISDEKSEEWPFTVTVHDKESDTIKDELGILIMCDGIRCAKNIKKSHIFDLLGTI